MIHQEPTVKLTTQFVGLYYLSTLSSQEAKVRDMQSEKESLLAKLKSTVNERNTTVNSLQAEIDQLKIFLDDTIQKSDQDRFESDQYRQNMELHLEQRETDERDRASRDEETIRNLEQKLTAQKRLTSSHIQALYEECWKQGQILQLMHSNLLLEDERTSDTTSTTSRCISSSITSNTNEMSRQSIQTVMENLQKGGVELSNINWEELLSQQEENDEGTEHRAVHGYLNNQIHLNWESIEDTIKHVQLYRKALETKAKNELDALKESMEKRISLFQNESREKDEKHSALSNEYSRIKTQLDASLEQISEFKEERSKCTNIIQMLEQSLFVTNQSLNGTKDELEQVSRLHSGACSS
jgi:hypothetical protein